LNRLWHCIHPAGPDQDSAILIDRKLARLDDFRFQIFEVSIIELELPLEGSGVLGDRTLFGLRHAANLWQIKAALQQRLTHVSGQAHAPSPSIYDALAGLWLHPQ